MKHINTTLITIGLAFCTHLRAQTIALAGDSTVASYDSSSKKQGWGYSFKKFVSSNVRVSNYAKGGRTTRTFRSEGHWKKLLSSKPKFVFVQFGHNDATSERKIPIKEYRSNLAKMIQEAEKQKALIYMVTPPHRCRFKNKKVTEEMGDFVSAMRSVAAEYDVPVLDLYKRSGDLLNKLGTKACKEYYFSSSDTTHFNKKGSEWIASIVASEAKKDADLARYMK